MSVTDALGTSRPIVSTHSSLATQLSSLHPKWPEQREWSPKLTMQVSVYSMRSEHWSDCSKISLKSAPLTDGRYTCSSVAGLLNPITSQ